MTTFDLLILHWKTPKMEKKIKNSDLENRGEKNSHKLGFKLYAPDYLLNVIPHFLFTEHNAKTLLKTLSEGDYKSCNYV